MVLKKRGKDNGGFTLVELLVVLSIVAIIAAALGFGYSGWQGKYKVESQTKQLYADLVSARVRAMQRGAPCFVDFPADNQYALKDDTPPLNNYLDGGDAEVPTYPKTILDDYTLVWISAGGITRAKAALSFDKKGLISYCDKTPVPPACNPASPNNVTIILQPDDPASTVYPDYNCVVLTQTMMNEGQTVCTGTKTPCNKDADCPGGFCSLCQIR